ncbi:aspartate aminotransferase family protein [Sphingomonas sp. CL5.1]|uniref:aminotransferase family protein n=1 Tax=Sphingomonas sp. CL5.1 TaxID=2653203 RepID=UPI0020C6B382|nr:aminotransferase class III-fold pyridoxal phosphate-dependent enzyme [Sphingomonas sp. CL5.1]
MNHHISTNYGPLAPEGDWARAFSYHPFSPEIDRAEGLYIFDTQGNRYIDATGGPFCVNLGHGHPRVKAAIASQLDKFAYAHPTLANRPRAELCKAIASITPGDLNTSYLVSGGSEAVETAVKIARQYQLAAGRPGKYKIISNYDAYHGMTLATMSLSGNPGTVGRYEPMISQWPKFNQYSDYTRPANMSREDWAIATARKLDEIISYEGADSVAAFIATPHGSGPDYGTVPPAIYWREIRRICDENDVLLISDEVVTGFGRTGKWCGMEHFDVIPDIMTFAKGINSGYLPLGAVTVSDKVNEPFKAGTPFIHGFTSGGNPVAAASGVATIDAIRDEGLLERVNERGAQLFSHAERLRRHPTVADVRGWGLFMVLELVQNAEDRSYFPPEAGAEQRFQEIALSNGLVFYSTLYGANRRPVIKRGLPMWVSPAYTVTSEQIEEIVDRLDRTLHQWEQAMSAG